MCHSPIYLRSQQNVFCMLHTKKTSDFLLHRKCIKCVLSQTLAHLRLEVAVDTRRVDRHFALGCILEEGLSNHLQVGQGRDEYFVLVGVLRLCVCVCVSNTCTSVHLCMCVYIYCVLLNIYIYTVFYTNIYTYVETQTRNDRLAPRSMSPTSNRKSTGIALPPR